MNRTLKPDWRRLATLLGILVICAGSTTSNRSCSLRSSDDGGDGGDDPTFVATLQLQDVQGNVTDTFDRSETIQMILTVRNRTDETQTLDFDTSRQSDFVVVRENTDDVIWQLSDVSGPETQTPSTLEFAPNQVRTITTSWDQIRSDGDALRVGSYEARGVLVFDGFDSSPLRASQLGSPLERFTVN